MTLPFLKPKAKKREQIFAVDLGGRVSKAVLLDAKGSGYVLSRYMLLDAPIAEKSLSAEVMAEHFKAIAAGLQAKTKDLVLSIGIQDTVLRTVELPLMPVDEIRQMLRFNSKTYLQQDLQDYVFDCFIVAPGIIPGQPLPDKAPAPSAKHKVWVGGIKRENLEIIERAVKLAGMVPSSVTLGLLGPSNAFELLPPMREAVALVDLGFKNSNISVVAQGELCLSRVVETGGHQITTGLAESMGISYAEAEGIKVGMPQEVEAHLLPVLGPLGRDLRASIDFFEHHQDLPVGQVFVSGGAARSEYFIQTLQTELMIPCKVWNPVTPLELALSQAQTEELSREASQLCVAIGAAASVL